MNDLDELIRDGLASAADHIEPLEPGELARRLEGARRSGDRSRSRRMRQVVGVAVAASVVAAVAVVGALNAADDGAEDVHTAPETTTTMIMPAGDPWEGLAPGWHAIDTGPVPAMSSGIGLVWTGADLVAAGEGSAFAYRPTTKTWRDLELPSSLADSSVHLVWTGEVVVAINHTYGDQPPHSASWDPATGEWTDLGDVPQAPELTAALGLGGSNPVGPAGRLALFWSGERVLDLSHGAALDPATGTWEVLPFPDDLVSFSALLYTSAVWTGSEAMLVAWTNHAGLAWNATGTEYREVPGPPDDLLLGNVVPWTVATMVDGQVVLIATEPDVDGTADPNAADRGRSISLDPSAGTWTKEDDVPGLLGQNGCPYLAGSVGDRLVIARCDEQPPSYRAPGGAWTTTGTSTLMWNCCLSNWVAADDALVVWNTDADTLNNPDAPYVQAEVWIPPPD